VTTQDQAKRPACDEGFRGVRHSLNRVGMFTMIAKGSATSGVSMATAASRPVEVEPVNNQRQMIVSWREGIDVRVHSLLKYSAISGAEGDARGVPMPPGNLPQGKGYYETGCEILKQVADRFYYRCRPLTKVVFGYFLSGNCMHWKHVRSELSESEAKFFLDRGKRSPYHSHKFSGAFPAHAKFHLHAKGKVVNCCSHFWGGADGSEAGHDGTRFRKAETDRPNQANESIPRLRSLREDRPVGVISIPSAHGRRRY
jgi:hypothetical protein